MLVLSRKLGETILIDGKIRVTVNRIKGKQVRIAVEAPGMKIDRAECVNQMTNKKPDEPSPA